MPAPSRRHGVDVNVNATTGQNHHHLQTNERTNGCNLEDPRAAPHARTHSMPHATTPHLNAKTTIASTAKIAIEASRGLNATQRSAAQYPGITLAPAARNTELLLFLLRPASQRDAWRMQGLSRLNAPFVPCHKRDGLPPLAARARDSRCVSRHALFRAWGWKFAPGDGSSQLDVVWMVGGWGLTFAFAFLGWRVALR